MQIERQKLFTNRQLIRLIMPLMMEQALAFLVGMVDGIMASSVSETAMSGVSLVNNISAVILNLFTALSTGGAVVVSQYLGARQKETAKHACGQLITMAVGVSVVLMAVSMLFAKQLLQLFFGDIEVDVMNAAYTYFMYNAISFPFIALYNSGAAIFRSHGNSKISLYVSILRNVVNIVGNAICVYGLHMGVEGVAIPTVISRIVGAVTILVMVMTSKMEIRPDKKDIFHIQVKLIRKMLNVAVPTAFETSLFALGRVFTLSMITGFGTYQIAANTTANALVNIVGVVPTAMRVSALTVIGRCVGARDFEQVRENTRKLILWCYALHTVVAGAVLFLRYQCINVYDSLSPETIELAAKLLVIYLVPAIAVYPLAFVTPGVLRGASDGGFTLFGSLLSMAVRLIVAYILCVSLGWGAVGVWIGMVSDWVVRIIVFSGRYLSGGWKKKWMLD